MGEKIWKKMTQEQNDEVGNNQHNTGTNSEERE